MCLLRPLGQVHAVEVTLDGQRHRLRTDLVGSAHHAFTAAGVRSPSVVTPLGPIAEAPDATTAGGRGPAWPRPSPSDAGQ